MDFKTLQGTVASGLGKGAEFTALPWAKTQFIEQLGIEPWPGTLNLQLETADQLALWQAASDEPHAMIRAPADPTACDAACFHVLVEERFTGAIVQPRVDGYSPGQLEIISPVALRQSLSLHDGQLIGIQLVKNLQAEVIIFDLDGTLLDTIEAFYILARRAGEEFGLAMVRDNVHQLLNFGKPYWETVLPENTIGRQTKIDALNKRAIQLWPEVMAKHARVFPGVKHTLGKLKDRGKKLGIVTGSSRSSVELLFSCGVGPMFDAVVTGEETKKRKPDPEGILRCLEKLGVKADESVYVGDTFIDMRAGRAAGLRAIGVLSGAGTSATLCDAGAQRIIRDHSVLGEVI